MRHPRQRHCTKLTTFTSVHQWTHGYDFYTPPRTVVAHNYDRVRKGFWHADNDRARVSMRRLKQLFGVDTGPEADAVQSAPYYGIGGRRTRDEYYAFSGIDPR